MGLYVAVDEITNSEMVPEFMAFKTNELLIHIGKYDNKQKAKNLWYIIVSSFGLMMSLL